MASETEINVRSFYRTVFGQAARNTRKLVGDHVAFAITVVVVSFIVGVGLGAAVSGKSVTTLVLYPLATLGLVCFFALCRELVLEPVRRARKAAEERESLRAELVAAPSGDEQLMADLGALAAEVDAFQEQRRIARGRIPGTQGGQFSIETWRLFQERFGPRAFRMCDRLHKRGWLTEDQWAYLQASDTFPIKIGEAIVQVARRFGALE